MYLLDSLGMQFTGAESVETLQDYSIKNKQAITDKRMSSKEEKYTDLDTELKESILGGRIKKSKEDLNYAEDFEDGNFS